MQQTAGAEAKPLAKRALSSLRLTVEELQGLPAELIHELTLEAQALAYRRPVVCIAVPAHWEEGPGFGAMKKQYAHRIKLSTR